MLTPSSKVGVCRKVSRFKGRESPVQEPFPFRSPALSQRTSGGIRKRDLDWKCSCRVRGLRGV